MSRIANNPVKIPAGVTISIEPTQITVEGSKGKLTQALTSNVLVKRTTLEEGGAEVLTFTPENKDADPMAGTTRALVNNMVTGVTEGFSRTLQLVGVG